MQSEVGHPWFHSAVERLDVRRRDRLLAIDCVEREAHALRSMVGSQGELMFVVRQREVAERLALLDWQQVRIVAHAVDGGETFGQFDAVLVAPRAGPLLTPADYGALLRRNLRPGGRFVVDLPAPDAVPDLRAAWTELSFDPERLHPLFGPSDLELADGLRRTGLRNVHCALGSHLLHLTAPADLVASFADCLGLSDDESTELAHWIIRRRQDPGPLDALVHRTQVGGQR